MGVNLEVHAEGVASSIRLYDVSEEDAISYIAFFAKQNNVKIPEDQEIDIPRDGVEQVWFGEEDELSAFYFS